MINRVFAAETFERDVEEFVDEPGFEIHLGADAWRRNCFIERTRCSLKPPSDAGAEINAVRAHDGRLQARDREVSQEDLTRNTATSAKRFGSKVICRAPCKKMRFSMVQFCICDQALEIVNGEEVDVGRIEPIVRKQLGFGRAAGEQMRQPHTPVAEVRERDDGAASHAQHLAQHFQRRARFLQGLAQDHVIEGLVREDRPARPRYRCEKPKRRARWLAGLSILRSPRRAHPRACFRPARPATRPRRSPDPARAPWAR